MPLPFLQERMRKNKTAIMEMGKAPVDVASEKSMGEEKDERLQMIEMVAVDLLRSIESKSIKDMSQTLLKLFDILEMLPHAEEKLEYPEAGE